MSIVPMTNIPNLVTVTGACRLHWPRGHPSIAEKRSSPFGPPRLETERNIDPRSEIAQIPALETLPELGRIL